MNEIQENPTGDRPGLRNNALACMDPADLKTPFRVTCAWCGEVLKDGPGPVSHGMCSTCHAAFLAMLPEA